KSLRSMLPMRRWLKSDGSKLSSALYPKMLIFTEDAHLKALRTFETDEHLRGMQVVFTSNQQASAKPTRFVRTRSRRCSCALSRCVASSRTRDVAGLRAGRDRPGSARGERH